MAEEKKPNQRAGGVHAGHRQRVRRRFLKTGLDGFEDYQVLELLLFYAIPRRDVNETAHLLINRFGSLAGVLDAPEKELCEIPGVGPAVAQFLNLIPEIMVQSTHLSSQRQSLICRTPQDLADLLAEREIDLPLGEIMMILIDSNYQVVSMHPIGNFEALTLHAMVCHTSRSRASRVVLVERMEDCATPPNSKRLQVLNDLSHKMQIMETPIWDYYTVDFSGELPHSYRRHGQLLPQ